MIEDKEIRELFKAECEEHLQGLEQGLLTLEASPEDGATLQAVFRAAHSLKGAARMLGILPLERIAHEGEEFLGAVRRGQAVVSAEMADRLSVALDAMRALVQEAVTGQAAGVDVESVLSQLGGAPRPAAGAESAAAQPASPTQLRPPSSSGYPPARPPEPEPAAEQREPRTEHEEAAPPPPSPPNAEPARSDLAGAETEAAQGAESQEPGPAAVPLAGTPSPLPAVSPPEAPQGILSVLPPPASLAGHDARDGDRSVATPRGVIAPGVAAGVPAEVAPAATSPATIDTIRIASQKLDTLMVLAGELVVTTSRLERGMAALVEAGAARQARTGLATRTARLPAASARSAEPASRERLPVEEMARLLAVADELEESIRKLRLLPLTALFNLFPRLVRDLARGLGKEVRLIIEGGDTTADKRILEEMKDPLMHMLRNAIDHGIEPPAEREACGKPREGRLTLRALQTAVSVIIELEDDGRGLDLDAIRRAALKRQLLREEELAQMPEERVRSLIFAPGFSTSLIVTDLSGRGVGMDVVRANVERLKGSIRVDSRPGEGCRFQLQFPLTLATTRVLLARAGSWSYAMPVDFVEGTLLVAPEELFTLEGRETISVQGQPVPAARLSDLLELPGGNGGPAAAGSRPSTGLKASASSPMAQGRQPTAHPKRQPCVLLSVGPHRIALFVDALLDEQEVVLKPLGGLLRRVRTVSGATILGTGELCMVLNCHDLIEAVRRQNLAPRLPAPAETVEPPRAILLVEDSITTRVQEKRILEGAGYEVVTAVDGADALVKLSTRSFDAIVSDIEMPNLDGLALTERLRQDPRYREIPILLVTTLSSEEDRRRGIEAGANAYITKGAFEQQVLLDTLGRLV
jgi:two-component system chemotaxis sensor kinase CheA